MKLTKEQIEKIQELYKSGKNQHEIAKELNVTQPTICYWVENRERVIKRNIERYRNKSKEEKKLIQVNARDYQREYHKNRYWNDETFRNKIKERAREYKRGKKGESGNNK